jgi:hypothetical protein
MDYFRAYSISSDDGVVAAWDSVAAAAEVPSLRQLIAERGAEIFPEFARRYSEVRALPRSARRALQRSLAHSRELANIPAEWRQKLAYSIAGAALLLALGGVAQAGTMTVMAKTAPDILSDGKCSLNEAIVNANNQAMTFPDCPGVTAGPNTIMLPKGTILLTVPFSPLSSDTGTPVIMSDITIQGNKTKIVRLPSASPFRLFEVNGGTLTLDNVTLSSGSGGAVYSSGALIIKNSIIANNSATLGGGVSIGAGYAYIGGSLITGNTARACGGIYSYIFSTLVIKNSTISKNSAQQYAGGGICSQSATVSIENSVVTGNTAGAGGGVRAVGGLLTISNSIISKNTAGAYAGGVYVHGNVTHIYDSTITGNKAGYDGGGVWQVGGGSTEIDNSTIAKNSAGRNGGGVFNSYAGFQLTNSTITGNKAGGDGGGVWQGGIGGSTVIDNSTISKNSAHSGGGVENGSGTFTLTNSTISGNKATYRGGGVDNSGSAVFNHDGTDTISGNKAALDPDIH